MEGQPASKGRLAKPLLPVSFPLSRSEGQGSRVPTPRGGFPISVSWDEGRRARHSMKQRSQSCLDLSHWRPLQRSGAFSPYRFSAPAYRASTPVDAATGHAESERRGARGLLSHRQKKKTGHSRDEAKAFQQDPARQILETVLVSKKWSGLRSFSLYFFPSHSISFSTLFVIFESSRVSSRAFSRCVPPRHLLSSELLDLLERERESSRAGARERVKQEGRVLWSEGRRLVSACLCQSLSPARSLSLSLSFPLLLLLRQHKIQVLDSLFTRNRSP